MKQCKIQIFPLIFLIVILTACSNPQETARIQLAEMNVEYNSDSFVKAAQTKELKVVKLFIQTGINPNIRDERGNTALLQAARYGAVGVAEILLEKGANVEVTDTLIGGSALLWAATGGFDPIVKLLLDNGATLEAKENRQGVNALMAAATNGKTGTVLLLLEKGADINALDNYNRTALIWAAQNGRADTVQALLEKRADTAFKEKINGRNALMTAAARGKTETVKVLLDRDADLKARDAKGKTPLILAAQGGWPDSVKLLLESGAGLNDRDLEGNTALSLAQAYRHSDIVEMLMKNGANGQSTALITTGQVREITITGKITSEESGYYIQGQIPREIFIIDNPNLTVLEELAKSGKTVIMKTRIILGDNVSIETIDGKPYKGDDE